MQPLRADQPLVSVIIPCYKQAEYLAQAIESALSQTYDQVEVIVVDDGSPDGVAEVASRYPAVKYVHQRNAGLAAARNTGLRESHGELVVFLDSDDWLLPGAIETGVDAFQAHPESGYVAGLAQWTDPEGSPIDTPPRPEIGEDILEQLLVNNCRTWILAAMYRAEVVRAVGGFDASVTHLEDWDLNLRMARTAPVHFHDAVVGAYRRDSSTLSGNSRAMLRSVTRMLRRHQRELRWQPKYERACERGVRLHREMFGERIVEQARVHWRQREWQPLLVATVFLLRFHPRALSERLARKLRLKVRWSVGPRSEDSSD